MSPSPGRSETEVWKVRIKSNNIEWEGPIVAVWEVASDPISDNYLQSEISAHELLREWAKVVRQRYPDGLIPIYWFAMSEEAAKFERIPVQFHHASQEDFLTFSTWPINTKTGEPLNWLRLPVIDKLWSATRANKGGFIQEATGWKPAILQPFVYLPSLTESQQR